MWRKIQANGLTDTYTTNEEANVKLKSLISLAYHARDWDRLAAVAAGVAAEAGRRSSDGWDPWPARGYLAGASLALGDEEPRRRLLAEASTCGDALLSLVRVERACGSEHAAADGELLAACAPGYWQSLEEGRVP